MLSFQVFSPNWFTQTFTDVILYVQPVKHEASGSALRSLEVITTMTELETLQNAVRDLTGHIQTIAKAVLVKADEDDEDEDMDYKDKEDKAIVSKRGHMSKRGMYKDEMEDPMAPPAEPPMPGVEDDMGYGEDEEVPPMDVDPAEDQMAMAYKQLVKAQKRFNRIKKGFDDVADVKSDEHDAPFDEKDGSVEGNEPQPAGDQGGDREDESFGPGGEASRAYGGGTYKQLMTQISKLTKQVEGISNGTVIAKAVVPALGDTTVPGQVVTREVQEQVKNMPYKQINRFREEIGDLPKHGIIG